MAYLKVLMRLLIATGLFALQLSSFSIAQTKITNAERVAAADFVLPNGTMMYSDGYNNFYLYQNFIYLCWVGYIEEVSKTPVALCEKQINAARQFYSPKDFGEISIYLENTALILTDENTEVISKDTFEGVGYTFYKSTSILWVCAVNADLFLLCKKNSDPASLD